MTTVPVQSIQSSINKISTFKSNSTLIQVATSMITSGEVNTTLDFVNKFMFALDSEESFPINIDMLVEEKIYDTRGNANRSLKKFLQKELITRFKKPLPSKGKRF